jgi:hypothetical protein
MEKKKFVVAYHFKAEFEDTTDAGAMTQAAAALGTGFTKTKGLALSVIAVIPIAETPAPVAIAPKPTEVQELAKEAGTTSPL